MPRALMATAGVFIAFASLGARGSVVDQQPPSAPQQSARLEPLPREPNTASVILVPMGEDRSPEAVKLTSVAEGVRFDIDDDHRPEQIAWTQRDVNVAFLGADRNGNSVIDNGSELFGDKMFPDISSALVSLMRLEGPRPGGAIDSSDPLYQKVVLWTDRNHDGISQPNEVVRVRDVIARVGLSFGLVNVRDAHGNLLREKGWSIDIKDLRGRADDRLRPIFEVSLAFIP